jgi:uncharacterized repeat protein (TIGR01451 family)
MIQLVSVSESQKHSIPLTDPKTIFMRNLTWRWWLALTGASAMLASPAAADDTFPPCWRGRPGTTYQQWTFNTSANPAAPEFATNPFGAPQAVVTLGAAGAGWIDQQPIIFGNTRTGVWDLGSGSGSGGNISLTIPNDTAPAGSWKFVYVQVTQYRDGLYNQLANVAVPGGTLVRSQLRTNESLGPPFNGKWLVQQSVWLLEPCPTSETITISSPTPTNSVAIDQVVIDTRCATRDEGDISPPCWRRQLGSTYQNWSFHRPGNPSAPEDVFSPGSPQASITLGALALGWQDVLVGFGCRQGYWDLGSGGEMSLAVPNTAGSPTSYKNIQVQVVEFQDSLAYNQLATVSIAGATMLSQETTSIEATLTGNWVVHRSVWRLAPCPTAETVVITAPAGSALIDQVVVDTLCVDLAPTCPPDQTVNAAPGQCSASVSWPLPPVDGCIITAASCSPPSGSSFNVGTTPVTCAIADGLGGTTACNFTVTVLDNQPPILTCPADMVVGTSVTPSLCGAVVNFTATVTDNCPGATVTCTPASGSTFPLGMTTVTCTARDANLNPSAACNFKVTVVDFSGDANPPCWRGRPGDTTHQHWAFADNDDPASPEVVSSPGSPQADVQLGALALGWQDVIFGFGCKQGYWDLGADGTITLSVPNFTGPPTAYKYIRVQVTEFRDSLAYNVSPAKAVTGATLISQRETSIETTLTGEWIVHESVWRFATCPTDETIVLTAPPTSALIDQIVVDTFCTEPPVCPTDITGDADPGQCVKSGITWSLPAADGCVIRSVVCRTNGVIVTQPASFPVGQTAVACSITDAENQFITCNFVVTINDIEPPVILSCAPPQTASANALCQAAVPDFTGSVSATDCRTITVTQSPLAGSLVGLGPHTITLTATDAGGLSTSCTTTFTVLDTTPPVFTATAPDQAASANAVCQAAVPDVVALSAATDNCDPTVTLTQSPAAGTLVGLGTTVITVTASDDAGNTATDLVDFVVSDTTAPVIATCAPAQSANAAANCEVAVPDFTGGVTASDNCDTSLTVTQSPAAGTLVGTGTHTVILTVSDDSGNTATCTTIFIVQPVADLAVQIVSSPEPVTVGQPLSYAVTVSNLGPCPASGVLVNNVLSAGQVLVAVTDPGTSVARACPTPGPSVWYRAEGNADDSVGVNHGTISGGVSFGPQAVAQGFIFDGLTGYVGVPDAPALQPASLTIEGWIQIDDPNGLHVVLAKPQGPGLPDSYSVWIASGVLHAAISDATGSGPFLKYPNFPTSSLFLVSDITDLQSLANKLKTPAPADLVSQYLNSQLSAETLALLAAYAGGPNALLQHHLVLDFNTIIQSGPLYTPARFAGVTLSAETLYVLGQNPTGIDLVRLNRLLIRDAYPAEIVNNLFPQLNQRYHIAYTFDPATQKQALYVDGQLVDSSFVTKTITYGNRPLLLGASENAGSADYFYQGELDELAIYHRALTGIEVQGIHGTGGNGKCFNTGPVVVGALASGASRSFTVVAVPTTCPTASSQATVSGIETDPVLANNTATATATVAELDPSQLRLSIRRVSVNNNNVEISWPITCAPYVLQTTDDLSPYPAILWTPASVPTLILQGRYSTVIPASEAHRFFRLRSP